MKRLKLIQDSFDFIRFNLYKIFPEEVLKVEFTRHAGYRLDLDNPKTYNEKLQWLKLYWYDPIATICADKYLVRDYIKEKNLSNILNELYGVYESVDDIDIEKLPDKFVMKVTHGCGQNLICIDKNKVDWKSERDRFKKWLNKSHFYDSLEWVYRDIKPRVIVEKLIETQDEKPPKDYKVFCFNGEPRYIFVAIGRGDNSTKFDFYDLQWNKLNVKNHYPNSDLIMEKPKQLKDIIKYSKIISKGFPHMRVDFYVENNKVIFGECTFFHFSGSQPFEPKSFDYELGSFLGLPPKLVVKNL